MPRSSLRFILPIGIVLFLVLPSTIDFAMDWLWFGELGYRDLFLRRFQVGGTLCAVVFFAAFFILFGNIWPAVSTITGPYVVLAGTVHPAAIRREHFRSLAVGASAVLALLIGIFAATQWLTWLQFVHRQPFGIADPILGHDVGFYVFTLPMLDLIKQLSLLIVGLALVACAAAYVLAGALSFTSRSGFSVGRKARRHLCLLTAAMFIILGFYAYLDIPQLLTTVGGPGTVHGASYADVAARLPALRLLIAVSLLAAALTMFHAFSRSWWPLPVALGLYFATSLGGSIYAAAIQRFVVTPNEQIRETPFMIHNIEATRRAFALEDVETRDVSGDAQLTREDIIQNADTIRNVRLWDHQPLLDTFGQIQEIRTYYDFASVDNDRYTIDGELRQVMLSARELNTQNLPNRTWINERLTFTHGYGVTLGPVNQVTQEGLPVLFLKDIPPQSSIPADIAVTEPSIYFGELSSDYVLVNTTAREFHYPKGNDNVDTTYAGTGGVPIGGLWRKLLFSLGFQSVQILLSNDVTAESRILYHRNIGDRVTTIAPFFRYDGDPYLVVSGGRLFWIRDGYTLTGRYPYSTPAVNGVNYIRNSIKVVIDAYNGTTDFFLADPGDPLVLTLAAIFPGFLKPLESMPADLRRHLRYPEAIFGLQTSMYSTYHMTNPVVFYNKEDQWEVPAIDAEGNPVPMQPYYTIMRLPGEERAEFIQMLPLTPRGKDNLAAWMVARSDPSHYGKLQVFQFPKQKVVFGPRQIVARINQDQEISPQITLWNQQGSQVIQGTLLVIPIEESLLYVRPLYLKASAGRIPELKRVIVAYQNQIAMSETLESALDRIFGGGRTPSVSEAAASALAPGPPPVRPAPTSDMSALLTQARGHYQRALQAQRDGNWALYGEEIRLLGEILEKLK